MKKDKPAKKFEIADQTKVTEYARGVDTFLYAIGIEEYLVTDKSTLHDFPMEEDDVTEFNKQFEANLTLESTIWEAGKIIEEYFTAHPQEAESEEK